MIEFEKLTRRAAPPVGADEGALTAIALPDGAAYMRGDVAAAEGSAAGTKRPGGGAELGLFGLGDEIVQGALDDLRLTGEAMAEQRARVLQLVVDSLFQRDRDPGLGSGRDRMG